MMAGQPEEREKGRHYWRPIERSKQGVSSWLPIECAITGGNVHQKWRCGHFFWLRTHSNSPPAEQIHFAVAGVQDGQADAEQPPGAAAAAEGHLREEHRE